MNELILLDQSHVCLYLVLVLLQLLFPPNLGPVVFVDYLQFDLIFILTSKVVNLVLYLLCITVAFGFRWSEFLDEDLGCWLD